MMDRGFLVIEAVDTPGGATSALSGQRPSPMLGNAEVVIAQGIVMIPETISPHQRTRPRGFDGASHGGSPSKELTRPSSPRLHDGQLVEGAYSSLMVWRDGNEPRAHRHSPLNPAFTWCDRSCVA